MGSVFAQSMPAYAALTNQAIVSGQTPRGSVVDSPIATEVIATAPQVLQIAVTQNMLYSDSDGVAGWSAGDKILFEVSGENTSTVDLSTILLASTLTAGTDNRILDSVLTLQSGDNNAANIMEPGEIWVWTAEYTVQQSDIDAGLDYRNIVNISGEYNTSSGDGQSVSTVSITQSPSMAVAKNAISANFSGVGEAFDWEVAVTNDGNLTLSNMVIEDVGATSIVCSLSGDATIATLAPQAIETCSVQTSITAQNIADGRVVNIAEVTADAANATLLTASATAEALNEDADLTTVKTLDGTIDELAFGDVARYLIRVDNIGTRDATNVQLTDSLPAGLTATPDNGVATVGTYDAATGLWSIGNLKSGQSAVLTLEGTIAPSAIASTITNSIVAALADQPDSNATGDVLSVSFTPVISTIFANDDAPAAAINALNDVANALDILSNDLLNGTAPLPTLVQVSPIDALPTGFALSAEGVLSVAKGTASGDYDFDYMLCEVSNPLNCAQANIAVSIVNFASDIIGTLYLDQNNNGLMDTGDIGRDGYRVQLVDADGSIAAETITDNNGDYTLSGFPVGTYSIIYLNAKGVGAGLLRDVIASENQTSAMIANLPADPSGVLYNSVTGLPVGGSIARLYNADLNALLPASCLLPLQQSQRTDANGEYRFDIITGASAECPVARANYRLEISQPLRYQPLPSQNIRPQAGVLSAVVCPGDVVSGPKCGLHTTNDPPPLSTPSPYYLAFLIGRGDPDIIHNHVPIDPIISPATSGIFVSKKTNKPDAVRGESVLYNVEISNSGSFDYRLLSFRDILPAGLTYITGSASWNGSPLDVERDGNTMIFAGRPLAIGDDAQLSYSVRVGANAQLGEKSNQIYATTQNGQRISTVSTARIIVRPEPIFDCSDVIGKVFLDSNRNGRQDEGEAGISAARVATARGTLITTDAFGRFSVPCAELPDIQTGTNFILKLDTRSLPLGYFETTENPRVVRLTAGKASQINFGVAASRDVRIDLDANAFIAETVRPSTDLQAGLEQLARVLGREPSVLRLSYFSGSEAQGLITARLQTVENLLKAIMAENGSTETLSIETRVIR